LRTLWIWVIGKQPSPQIQGIWTFNW